MALVRLLVAVNRQFCCTQPSPWHHLAKKASLTLQWAPNFVGIRRDGHPWPRGSVLGPRLAHVATDSFVWPNHRQREKAPARGSLLVEWGGNRVYPLIENFPRSVFWNLDSFPLVLISLSIAE